MSSGEQLRLFVPERPDFSGIVWQQVWPLPHSSSRSSSRSSDGTGDEPRYVVIGAAKP